MVCVDIVLYCLKWNLNFKQKMAALEAKLIGSLSGYVALVTGASRGIGKGIAAMLCEAGATVYITGMEDA